MKTLNEILKIGLLLIAVILIIVYSTHSDDIKLLIMSFGCGILSRVEAIYDKINEKNR